MNPIYEIARRAWGLPHRVGRVEVRRDLRTTMADGTVLLSDHLLPAGDSTAPLILVRCPYGRRTLIALIYARFFAHQGFQVVVQSCRGTGGSGGRFDRPFLCEASDAADTIAWLRRQPFYPGRFATLGGSYLGYTQLAIPDEAKREIAAAVLQITPSSVRDIVWDGGAPGLEASLGWATQVTRGPDRMILNMLRGRRDARAIRAAGMAPRLLDSYLPVAGVPVGFLEDWWTHGAADPWWQDQDQSRSVDGFDCPVLVQGGWYDIFLEAGIAQYERLARRRDDARLTIGPWSHDSFTLKGARLILTEAADFIRSAFAGEPPGRRPVRLLDARTGAERRVAAWPPPVEERHVYLCPGGTLSAVAPDQAGGATAFSYDPRDPTPAIGGARLAPGAGPVDNAPLEQRPDVLTFETPPLDSPVRLAGASISLWVSSDVAAPQLFVRLNLVDAHGRSTNVTDRMTVLHLAAPGAPALVTIALPPTDLCVARGERLRLLIAGGAYPRYARSSGTPSAPDDRIEPCIATTAIHHDRAHPSSVSLRLEPTPQG